jgi:nicotinamidase-related amidase
MPTTLVVVDMQPEFDAANVPDVIVGVTKQILEAKKKRWPIVIVEYLPKDDIGETHGGLLSLLKGYNKKARIGKVDDDGSLEIVRALRRRKFTEKTLRVCGVNTDCCVAATVLGLLDRIEGEVEVVKDACEWDNNFQYDWRQFFKDPRIRLV